MENAGRGFTLVELLVVITIITILAALLLPTLEQGLELSRRSLCAGNIHQQYLAAAQYANDNMERLPLLWGRYCANFYGKLGYGGSPYDISGEMRNYVQYFSGGIDPGSNPATVPSRIAILRCPSARFLNRFASVGQQDTSYCYPGFGQWYDVSEMAHGTTRMDCIGNISGGYPIALIHDVFEGPKENPLGSLKNRALMNHTATGGDVAGGNVASGSGDTKWVNSPDWRPSSWGGDDTRSPSKKYYVFNGWYRWVVNASDSSASLWLWTPPNGNAIKAADNNRRFGYLP